MWTTPKGWPLYPIDHQPIGFDDVAEIEDYRRIGTDSVAIFQVGWTPDDVIPLAIAVA